MDDRNDRILFGWVVSPPVEPSEEAVVTTRLIFLLFTRFSYLVLGSSRSSHAPRSSLSIRGAAGSAKRATRS